MIRDSFDAANKVKLILPEVSNDGYIFASFDVESLFTNMLFKRIINLNLDRAYKSKLYLLNLKEKLLKS